MGTDPADSGVAETLGPRCPQREHPLPWMSVPPEGPHLLPHPGLGCPQRVPTASTIHNQDVPGAKTTVSPTWGQEVPRGSPWCPLPGMGVAQKVPTVPFTQSHGVPRGSPLHPPPTTQRPKTTVSPSVPYSRPGGTQRVPMVFLTCGTGIPRGFPCHPPPAAVVSLWCVSPQDQGVPPSWVHTGSPKPWEKVGPTLSPVGAGSPGRAPHFAASHPATALHAQEHPKHPLPPPHLSRDPPSTTPTHLSPTFRALRFSSKPRGVPGFFLRTEPPESGGAEPGGGSGPGRGGAGLGLTGRQYVAAFLRFLTSSSEIQRGGGGGGNPGPCSGELRRSTAAAPGGPRQSGGASRFTRVAPLRTAVEEEAGQPGGVGFVLPGGAETWQPAFLLLTPSPKQVRL